MKTRLLLVLSCGIIAAVVQLYLRPLWRHYSALTDSVLGGLPNFLAVLGFSLGFLAARKSAKSAIPTILAALGGIVAHEVFTQATPNHAFGGRFDWNDIVASLLGALAAYWLDAKLRATQGA